MTEPRQRPSWTTNVQWKGTDLCMDLWCPLCDEHSHFDGMFAYHVQCSSCGAVFKMPTDLPLEHVEGDITGPVLCEADDE